MNNAGAKSLGAVECLRNTWAPGGVTLQGCNAVAGVLQLQGASVAAVLQLFFVPGVPLAAVVLQCINGFHVNLPPPVALPGWHIVAILPVSGILKPPGDGMYFFSSLAATLAFKSGIQ